MYQRRCRKCGSHSLFTEQHGNNTGLYCSDCGAWQTWLGKDELHAFEHSQNERKNQSEYASSLDDVVPCTTVSSQDTNTSFRCHDAYFDSALPLFENRFELIPFKCFYPVTCHLYS